MRSEELSFLHILYPGSVTIFHLSNTSSSEYNLPFSPYSLSLSLFKGVSNSFNSFHLITFSPHTLLIIFSRALNQESLSIS